MALKALFPQMLHRHITNLGMRELSTSCRLLQDKNPRDPWTNKGPIPLPDETKWKGMHFDPDIRPGCEDWHEPVDIPFSGEETFDWPNYSKRIHAPDGTFRPGYVCHMRTKIKYSNDKLWYIACLVRGMTVDEALKQLKFCPLKGARVVEEVIQEAREMAVKEHHFEYATNMWVAESFSDNFDNIKGLKRHKGGRISMMKYRYISYFVRLEEGIPPKHYYKESDPKTTKQWLEHYLQDHRKKYIHKW